MKILLINQAFYPDLVATAQMSADLARELAGRGADVHVLAGARGYDNPDLEFPAVETWNGIRIERIKNLHLGKGSKWRRALTFASFIVLCALRLLRCGRYDTVIALTSPPMIATLAAVWVRWKGGRLIYWVMDLNPDEALAAGWLKKGSPAEWMLERVLRFSLKVSASVVVLDRFMRERILKRGIAPDHVTVFPLWARGGDLRFDPDGRRRFREQHGWEGKTVIMYAGNHSPCHPLDTLLHAARASTGIPNLLFVFIGGGSGFETIRQFADTHGVTNLQTLPYQPHDVLPAMLSAADYQVVVMGDAFVGVIHPCKIYNIMAAERPVVYIGPAQSHVTDLLGSEAEGRLAVSVRHGDVNGLVAGFQRLKDAPTARRMSHPPDGFTLQRLTDHVVNISTGAGSG